MHALDWVGIDGRQKSTDDARAVAKVPNPLPVRLEHIQELCNGWTDAHLQDTPIATGALKHN
jgi:hypothetical protein